MKLLAVVEEYVGQEGDADERHTSLSILFHSYSTEADLILKIQTRQILWKEKGEFAGAGFVYDLAKSLFVWLLSLLNYSRAKQSRGKP